MTRVISQIFCLFVVLAAVGCGGKDAAKTSDVSGVDNGSVAGTAIGAEGGTVSGPEGSSLEVPAGALSESVTLTIELATDAPEIDQSLTLLTPVLEIGPSGTEFLVPAVLHLPFDESSIPEGVGMDGLTVLINHDPRQGWTSLETAVEDGRLVATIPHLSKLAGVAGCRTTGQGCYVDSVCCNGLTCHGEGDKCGPCIQAGESCAGAEFDCCGGMICHEDTCTTCRKPGTACEDTLDCCDSSAHSCIDGLCGQCVPTGGPCKHIGDCCDYDEMCVEGVCAAECGAVGQSCLIDDDCCKVSTKPFCYEGKCSDCLPEGAGLCTSWDLCCDGMRCGVLPFVCEQCLADGQSCVEDVECCGYQCLGGSCSDCKKGGFVCEGDEQCCSGSCVDHFCNACSESSGECSDTSDCCQGLGLQCFSTKCLTCVEKGAECDSTHPCCDQTLTCKSFEGPTTCQECQTAGACISDEFCCEGFLCIEQECQVCKESGSCQSDHHCCGEFVCLDDQCGQCWKEGDVCGAKIPCCDSNLQCLLDGTCGACRDEGQECGGPTDCCEGLACEDSKCVESCVPDMEECSDTLPCCNNGSCFMDQVCMPECSPAGYPCQEGVCCPDVPCIDDYCFDCADEGEECDKDDDCCAAPGLYCDKENFECAKMGGGGQCNCNTPGVTFTIIKEPSAGYCGFDSDAAMKGFCNYVSEGADVDDKTILSDTQCDLQINCP